MGKIIEGKKIPTFKADATNDSVFDLKNNKKNLVIYFYPKDNTPGTFLIDSNNKLIKEWRKVKVPGHAQEVLETLEEYLKS